MSPFACHESIPPRATGVFGKGQALTKSKSLLVALAAWVGLEIVVFSLVAEVIGLIPAILLGLATTLLGLADARRLLTYLRLRMTKKPARREGALVDGGLQALGSALLLLPGFLSDIAGLALKSPSIRESVAGRLRKKGAGPTTIDLAPNEWKAIRDQKPRRRTPKPVQNAAPESAQK